MHWSRGNQVESPMEVLPPAQMTRTVQGQDVQRKDDPSALMAEAASVDRGIEIRIELVSEDECLLA